MIINLDKHYFPVEVPVGATVRINGTNVALTSGVYYAHYSSFFPATFTSFYAHLVARLATVLGGVWDVEPFRPSGYAFTSGIRLKVTGITALTIDLSSTTQVVRQLLGFGATNTSTVNFVSNRLEGPYAAFGAWSPWSCFDGRATSKDSQRSRIIASSSDSPEDAVRTIWRDRKVRLLTYEMVYGAYVYPERAGVQALADQALVALGDGNNSLAHLWAAASNTGRQTLVVYDLNDLDLTIPAIGHEAVLLGTAKAYGEMEDLASRNGIASDLWTVRVPYIVTGGNYGL